MRHVLKLRSREAMVRFRRYIGDICGCSDVVSSWHLNEQTAERDLTATDKNTWRGRGEPDALCRMDGRRMSWN